MLPDNIFQFVYKFIHFFKPNIEYADPYETQNPEFLSAWLYILRLKSSQLYIGSTTDLDQRYREHVAGKACRTTTIDPPVALLYSEDFETFSDARRREAQIKRWSRSKKEALVGGETQKLRELSKSR